MKSLSPTRSGRAKIAAAALASLAAAALVPTFATGATSGTPPPAGATVDTVTIKGGFSKGNLLHFVSPTTVHSGDYLEIDNKTNPHQVGPHTFSLVTQSSIPKTKKARKTCFVPHHICWEIGKGLGVKGNGPVTTNPSEAGLPGWDTEGTKSTVGDTWYTGNKPNTSFVQIVSADTSAGPKTLHFFCAIHPFMKGKITVLAPGT